MLERIILKGYKSISEGNIELRPVNVLIGANGAGKSNFISFDWVPFKADAHISMAGCVG